MVEDIEHLTANPEAHVFATQNAEREVLIEVHGVVIGDAGAANGVHSLVAASAERLQAERGRVKVLGHRTQNRRGAHHIRPLCSTAHPRAVAGDSNGEGETA